MTESIGWSNFARGRHSKDGGFSYFGGTDEAMEQLIRDNWDKRESGFGMDNTDKVCVVPIPAQDFYCPFVLLKDACNLEAEITQRREGEDSYVQVTGNGPAIEAGFAKVVLYSAQALIDDGEKRSGDFDWEIISIMASPVEDEPMHPLTMARNQLGKVGGSERTYTSEEWATAVWYWSQYVMRRV